MSTPHGVTANIPQTGAGPVPATSVHSVRLADLANAGPNGLSLPIPSSRFVNIENRLARPMLALFDTASQPRGLSFIVDDNERFAATFAFEVTVLTLIDLYASAGQNPIYLLAGQREGVRDDMSLPWLSQLGAAGIIPPDAGQILISASSLPVQIQREQRIPRSKSNYAQQVTSTGVQNMGIAASLATVGQGVAAAGYFNLISFLNPTATAFTATIYPVGSAVTIGNSYQITIAGNSAPTFPIECEQVDCAFQAAGQSVIGFQSVIMTANED